MHLVREGLQLFRELAIGLSSGLILLLHLRPDVPVPKCAPRFGQW